MTIKWKKFILTWRSYPLVMGRPLSHGEYMSEKKFWYKIEDSLYDEEEEKKEKKYVQLEIEFDEELVATI